MKQDNLYSPPTADLRISTSSTFTDASRGKRLGAAVLDIIIQMLILLIIGFLTYFLLDIEGDYYFNYFASLDDMNEYLIGFITIGIYSVFFIVVNGYLLLNYGQTIGKRIIGIHIVNLEDELPDFYHIIGLRFIAISLLGLLPVIGEFFGLIDVLFIFGTERRCLHDYLAKTRVVDKKSFQPEKNKSTQKSEKASIVISNEEINASGIKYSEYSQQELLETLNVIDHDEFPERTKSIKLALKRFE